MRVWDFDELADRQPILVFIAGNLIEAQKAERLLGEHGVDYALSVDRYRTTSLLSGEYAGLFIYVPRKDYHTARLALERQGLTETIDLDQSE